MSIANQKVLILGGSAGIGLATAHRLLEAGAQVLIASRRAERLRAAAELLEGKVTTLQVDVCDEDRVSALFEEVDSLHHLVVTASDAVLAPLADQPTAALRRLLDSKLVGQTLAVKHAAPRIRAGGSITLFSGIVSRKPLPGASAYASVGAAIEAAARTWALEYAPLRINTVIPGVIETDVWKQLMPADAVQAHFDQVSQTLPVGRAGRPDDVARAVQFLIESPFITGAAIPVDGGHQLI